MKYLPRVLLAVLLLGVLGTGGVILQQWWGERQHARTTAQWNHIDNSRSLAVDHTPWQVLLDDYLEFETPDGISLFDYENLQLDASDELDNYITALSAVDPRNTSRADQLAYWINLYNAATVALVSKHYPTSSITKLGESKLTFGPWDDKVVRVADQALSLNDIEHNILRPVFNDFRIHFAVNCASFGCPNLQSQAFTRDNVDALLESASREFLAHPRAIAFNADGLLQLSSIFDWYAEDFGKDLSAQLQTIAAYCPQPMASQLASHTGEIAYHYDWQLNALSY